MAFKTDGLAKAYTRGQSQAIALKNYASSAATNFAATTQSANAIIQTLNRHVEAIAEFDTLAAIPGLAQYARDQADDQAYDVVAEYNAMRAAAVSVRDWIINNFPVSGNGYIEKDTIDANGNVSVRQFTPAQTAGLVTELNALVATID